MSGAPHLEGAPINIQALKDHARKDLIRVLDSVRGQKALVLDKDISGPLGLIAEGSLVKEHGVEKIYHLKNEPLKTDCRKIVYIVRPKVKFMPFIAEHVRQHAIEGEKKDYSVFFVPRRTMICERVLEEEGVYGDLTIDELHLDLFPFERDVLSLEFKMAYRECMLDGDRSSLYYVARSLIRLQSMFGIIPVIKGVGGMSKLVADMLVRMKKEMGVDEPSMSPEIQELILIDRHVDMVTPLLTSLTYEGLIDETFGIVNGYVELDPEMVGQPAGGRPVMTPMNSSDPLFPIYRDLNFSVIGPQLNEKAKEIDLRYKKRHEAQTVSQIRDFMQSLRSLQQEHQSLRVHVNIAEKIQAQTKESQFHQRLAAEQNMLIESDTSLDLISELIGKCEPLDRVLRLVCLLSQTFNGIKPKKLVALKEELVQTYGYETLFTIENLERLGLLKVHERGRNWFSNVRDELRLVKDDIDEKEPDDIAYVYSGYAPLSVRLVQAAMNNWRGAEDALRAMPRAKAFEQRQSLPKGVAGSEAHDEASGATEDGGAGKQNVPVTLVFYIGGVTSTEVSALRFLSKKGERRDIIVGTTKIINGSSLLATLAERFV